MGSQLDLDDVAATSEKAKAELDKLRDDLASMRTQLDFLMSASRKTLEENMHLADGDNCTLLRLKRAVEMLTF